LDTERDCNLTDLEFLIPRRPLSLQAKRSSLRDWKAFVQAEAARVWKDPVIHAGDLQITLVYLCDISPPDTDNIVKPIQDALVGLVFSDDGLIADVDSHRRSLNGTLDLTRLPPLVLAGVASGQECVYVNVSSSRALEEYL
jgi:crossover junction endodeoxyribonuclease RusA